MMVEGIYGHTDFDKVSVGVIAGVVVSETFD